MVEKVWFPEGRRQQIIRITSDRKESNLSLFQVLQMWLLAKNPQEKTIQIWAILSICGQLMTVWGRSCRQQSAQRKLHPFSVCPEKAIPENREIKKWKLSFFHQRHALSMSFNIFVVTYRVTNFLPKLINMLLFSREKTEFPFLVFPYFRVMPPENTGRQQATISLRRLAPSTVEVVAQKYHPLPQIWF